MENINFMRKFFGVILGGLLLISSMLVVFLFKKSKEFYGEIQQLKYSFEKVSHEKEKLINYERMANFIQFHAQSLAELVLESEDGDTLLLEALPSDTVILFFYSKLNCSSCIESVLGPIGIQSPNYPFFFLISDYEVKRDLYNFKKRSGIHQDVFKDRTKMFSEIYETYPFILVQTPSSVFVFFPDTDFPERTARFLKQWKLFGE